MAIRNYKITNVGANKCLNIEGTNLTSLANHTNVTLRDDNDKNEQKWELSASTGDVFIKSVIDQRWGLNRYLVGTIQNCDIFPISGNADAQVTITYSPTTAQSKIKLKNPSYPNLYLTASGSANGTSVYWAADNGSNYQSWYITALPNYNILNGWLKLYFNQTVSGGTTVNIPSTNTKKDAWWDYENDPYKGKINPNAPCVNTVVVNKGIYGELTDANGRYWVAVGPNVTNPSQQSNQAIDASKIKYGAKLDAIIKDSSGIYYYVPTVVGDTKAHTWPDGIVQSGKTFPNATGTDNGNRSVIEFMGLSNGYGFGSYSIEKIYVYS